MNASVQFFRIVASGLIAPLRHPFGLALVSLPWLVLTIAIQVETAAHRSWLAFLGFGGRGWHYEEFEWEYSLRLAQLVAAILFALFWMRWVAHRPINTRELGDIAHRLLRVGIAVLKLSGVAIVTMIVWLIAGDIARDMMSNWYWDGARRCLAVMIGISIWMGCRIAPVLASAALDEDPLGVRQSWRATSGGDAWLLLAPMVPLLMIGFLKAHLLQGMGNTIPITFQDLLFDTKPLWKFAWQVDPIPLSMIVQSAIVTWLQWVWLLATLAQAYLHMRPPREEPTMDGESQRA